MRDAFLDWWFAHPSLFGLPFDFWTVVLFTLGTFVGSFLNVCIHRMPRDESVVSPPSHCPHCRYRIPLILNIPLVTWLWLRGRCRNCGAPISPRYFFVELLTGALFLAAWLGFGDASPGRALAYCALFSAFVVATFIDFEHFIIPDEITLGGAAAGFVASALVPALHGAAGATASMKASALGMAAGAGVVYVIVRLGKLAFGRENVAVGPGTRVVFHEDGIRLPDREIAFGDVFYRKSDTIRLQGTRVELADRCYPAAEVRLSPGRLEVGGDTLVPEEEPYLAATTDAVVLPREAMGLGDVKYMATLGAFLGWQAAVFSLGMASLVGAVVGVSLIAIGRREWSSRLPFGPYLTLGAMIWIFGGHQLWTRMFQLR